MANISFRNVNKTYDNGVEVVPDFSLEIQDKEFVVLVGPSGCGKSTTLRMIAGLEEITRGELFIGGKRMNDVAPKDRDIAMVFQNYALYPHMTVYKNMAFGLTLRKEPKEEIDRKVREAAKILELEPYLDRKPKALSGGQRQRVALGRAMVRNPSVFLLDEPLSNLDAKLRTEMRTQIAGLHKRLGTTFVYVTHDQTEAMTMGDRICVMKSGVMQQFDKPNVLYNTPCNLFVAGFIGSPQMNFINATVAKQESGYFFKFGEFTLKAAIEVKGLDDYVGKEVIIGIRPEDIQTEGIYTSIPNETQILATVELAELMGSETYLYMTLLDRKIVARVPSNIEASIHDTITLAVNTKKIHVFDKETEERIVSKKGTEGV